MRGVRTVLYDQEKDWRNPASRPDYCAAAAGAAAAAVEADALVSDLVGTGPDGSRPHSTLPTAKLNAMAEGGTPASFFALGDVGGRSHVTVGR
mmetsp:Transcript_48886/g.113320  ORF Transcript_48886/g.113320 Transcript_48886/m.113320 type:complete len:93 (+) Transcript_48886:36-314(+)